MQCTILMRWVRESVVIVLSKIYAVLSKRMLQVARKTGNRRKRYCELGL